MPRWLWIGPIGLLVLLVAVFGVRLGFERAAITETVVIKFYAERYLVDHRQVLGTEGQLTDCIAVPGETGGVWIEVRCSPQDGSPDFVYGADRKGAQVYAGRDGEEPQT